MAEVIEKLTDEELEEWRAVCLDSEAADCCPTDLSFEQVREIKRAYRDMQIRFQREYDLDETERVTISVITGQITYGEL